MLGNHAGVTVAQQQELARELRLRGGGLLTVGPDSNIRHFLPTLYGVGMLQVARVHPELVEERAEHTSTAYIRANSLCAWLTRPRTQGTVVRVSST